MHINRTALFILISTLTILTLTGCGLVEKTDPDRISSSQDSTSQSENLSEDISFPGTGMEEWPNFIPEAIPELEGDISAVMVAPESHIRIFYDNVTERQIENYLSLLQDQGFEFSYIVYQQEGFPDNAEERLAKGDYDAVDITKGEYHLNLSSGAGTAVFDIYTDGFEDLVAQAMTLKWPEDLIGKLSEPEGCALTSIIGSLESKYIIQCNCDDSDVLLNYVAQLNTQNFAVTDRSITTEGDTVARKLQKDSLIVTLSGMCNPNLTIEAESSDLVEWTSVLPKDFPQPADCTLSNIQTSGPNTTYIDCIPEKDDVMSSYADELVRIGFTEMTRLVNENDAVAMILLTRDQDLITLSLESTNLINITIYLEN